MKWIATILLTFVAFSLAAQPVEPTQVEYQGKLYWKYQSVDVHNNTPYKFNYQYDAKGEYLGWVYEFPRDGDWINFYKEDSTQVASIFQIKDSLINGLSTQYHLNGKRKSEYDFFKGEKNGKVRSWTEEGILTSAYQYEYKDYGNFQSSIQVGTWKNWFSDGGLMEVRNYLDGDSHGRQLEYYENGQIKQEAFYQNGEIDSTLTIYYPNGQITKQFRYRNGQFVAENPALEYHPNGSKSAEGALTGGRKIEQWVYFYKNGRKESEGEYGTYIYLHEHGDFHLSHKQGLWRYWHSNGQLKAYGKYGRETFDSIEVDVERETILSLKIGDWQYYDEHGDEISVEEFEKRGFKVNDY